MNTRRPESLLRSAILLGLLILVLNGNALDAFFVGDDYDFLKMVGRRDSPAEIVTMTFWGEWEPVWYLTWYVDQQLWGINPLGYHLTNLVWLIIAVVSLYWMMRLLWPEARLAAWAAALLFATHPLHDEAVTYLAARGHVICLALCLLSMCAYVRYRTASPDRARRAPLVLSLSLAFLAALAKETALILPVWIAVLESLVLARDRPAGRSLLSGAGAGALFIVPGAISLGLRFALVGTDSYKLAGLAGDWVELFSDLSGQLPYYALLGGLPIPFGLMDQPAIVGFGLLGWTILVAAVGASAVAAVAALGRHRATPACGMFALGMVIVASALAPVFWADLGLRRRYLFVPSVGVVIMAAVVLQWLQPRFARAVPALLGVLVLLGSAGTVYRNDLYCRAGDVARNLIETARGAPLAESVHWPEDRPPTVALVALPARYGGDSFSGAYVFHRSDLESAFRIFDVKQDSIIYALKFDHVDDLTTEVLGIAGRGLKLRFSFRGREAFEAALQADPSHDPQGDLIVASRIGHDPDSMTMDYVVEILPRFLRERAQLLLYSDGSFSRVPSRHGASRGGLAAR